MGTLAAATPRCERAYRSGARCSLHALKRRGPDSPNQGGERGRGAAQHFRSVQPTPSAPTILDHSLRAIDPCPVIVLDVRDGRPAP
jgi:hypothetical protein